ncbi:uncharacterized protein LOC116262884 [Nymphaea colorata]|uniref:EF-hand domain-containing protein n=1 Tax=Nymphaea colorata TaxID=210225 RepID=A0A5K0WMF3_9MAGN|nr:uncharacterized protein LOC116262884 [Nymphaea colorata]
MKFNGLKLTGLFKVRANSSSPTWSPGTICSSPSPPAGLPRNRAGTPTSVLPSPRRFLPSQMVTVPASVGEIVEESPSSSGYFSPAAQWEVDKVFKLFDDKGSGKISCHELGSILRWFSAEMNEEEVASIVHDADVDGDGFISLEEFEKLSKSPQAAAGSDLVDAFNVFDTDRDGKISVYELRRVFVALGDEDCTLEDCLRMIRGVDKDGDGYVDFEEFVTMMTRS